MEDSRIVDLFYERSEQAIDELMKKYGRIVKRLAANILTDGQDAEECVNDTWLAVWNNVPLQRPEPLSAYVCKITRNLALNRRRANTAARRDSRYDAALDELAEVLSAPLILISF